MLTTLTIDDDVMETAHQRAAELSLSVDRLVSDLLRDALSAEDTGNVVIRLNSSGFPVFHPPPGTRPITSEMVQQALDDEDLERATRF